MKLTRNAVFAALALVLLVPVAFASDEDDLRTMLHDFLANVDAAATHDRFWAEDLIYSSSTGLRFGKAEIMDSFEADDDSSDDSEPTVTYTAEEVQVRSYGDTAVVAFKLVSTPVDGAAPDYYHNTGTFVKREGKWQAVAWQATKIPPSE